MSEKPKCILATHNAHKLEELQQLLGQYLTLESLSLYSQESPVEDGLTFVENALIKARSAARLSGLPAVADDSGLVIPAFGGAPGLYSSRFAGENATDSQNNQALVERLQAEGLEAVKAHYHCTIVVIRAEKDPDPLIVQGRWQGLIKPTASGDQGFGYDPHFYIGPDFQQSAASLAAPIKNEMSHRGRAVSALIQALGLLQAGDPLFSA